MATEKNMDKDNELPKNTIIYYGKKTYYINPLIAKRAPPPKKEPEDLYENVEDDKDK